MQAGNDISISAAENHYADRQYRKDTKSGLMGSGGIGFTIGKQKETDDTTSKSLVHSGSSIGSLYGDTVIIADNHYNQTGSSVSTPVGNVTIAAKDINIAAAQDKYNRDNIHTFEKSGLTVAVNVPIVNAIQTANTAINRVGKSKNDRVNAMAVFNAGMDTYKAGEALNKLGSNPQSAAQNVSVSITVGQQKSRSENHTKDTVASASQINAGGTVNLLATGAGKDSNINIIGSDVAGSRGTHLQADNEINLLAAEQSHSERSSNKSSGWNAGVAISYGSGGASLGVTAGGNLGKGHGNGDETSYRNSHVGSSSGSTSLSSGGATNIIGAQVIGKGVSIDAAELNIASLQDKAKYDSKQQNISGQVTVGYGASGSASYSKSKIKADYAGVTEQSGIIAGDDGYQIKVKGNTDLKGAIITSASAAEAAGKNSLITGSLTSSDIKNHSDYSGSSIGIGASGNYHGGWDNSSINNQTGESVSNVKGTVGYGSDSGHTSSITHSGINTGNIIITDEAAQQQKTGKTVAETIAAIHTDISSEDYADKAGYLHNNFDKDKVQKELDLQREISQEFSDNMQTASAMINSKKDALKEKLKNEALSPEEREKYEKELSQWNAGGLLLNAIGAGLSAPTNSIGGIVAATASPIVSYQIGQYFKGKDAEGSTAHLVAHAVVGAAVAAAGGNNALAGGLAAAGTEALAPVVSKWLYGKESKDLTADEKATVSSIIGLAGAATGAAVGGSMADVAQGNQAGHTAVDNNALRNSKGESKLNTQEKILNEKLKKAGVQSADDYQRKYDACKTDQCRIQVEKEYLKASDEANKIILNLYMTGQITEEESKILLTSYANKMMRGAGESQRRFGSRIFDLNANEWIPASVIGNADFNQITMLNLVKKMKRSGASDEQIAIRVFQYQIAGSYIGSVSIMQQQVDTLLNSGVSVETVIRALSMKKGRRLTNDEIGLIKNRYSVMMQKQGSKAKAGKGTSGAGQAGNAASELPALPPGKQGSVIRNELLDHEYKQALDIVGYKGGTFKGATEKSQAGIDGWLNGVPVQLKEVQGQSIHSIRKNIVGGANDMAKAGYKGDLYIDASKTGVSMNEMINHFKPGSPVSNITKEGTVNNIYIKTQDGWLNVTGGSITKGGSK